MTAPRKARPPALRLVGAPKSRRALPPAVGPNRTRWAFASHGWEATVDVWSESAWDALDERPAQAQRQADGSRVLLKMA